MAVACSISKQKGSNMVSWWFTRVFRVTFPCRSLQAGIIKLQWWVEINFWKSQRWQMIWRWLESQNYLSKNMTVDEWSCLSGHSVGGFQHLPRQFEWNFTSKECNIVPIELGGSTQEKKREHWGRLSRMLLTLHISQAFLSVRNRAITGLQVEL